MFRRLQQGRGLACPPITPPSHRAILPRSLPVRNSATLSKRAFSSYSAKTYSSSSSSSSSIRSLLNRNSQSQPRPRSETSYASTTATPTLTTTTRRSFSSTPSVMVAEKIDGNAIAKSIRERIHVEIAEKQKLNPRFQPSLTIIQGALPPLPPLLALKFHSPESLLTCPSGSSLQSVTGPTLAPMSA